MTAELSSMWRKQVKWPTQCCRIKFVIKIAVWNENVFVKSGYVARSFESKTAVRERLEISSLRVTHDFSNIHKRIRSVEIPKLIVILVNDSDLSKSVAIRIEQTFIKAVSNEFFMVKTMKVYRGNNFFN